MTARLLRGDVLRFERAGMLCEWQCEIDDDDDVRAVRCMKDMCR
jgi:hypothetical protein